MDFKTSSAGKGDRIKNAIEKMHGNLVACCGADYIDDTSAGTSHTGPYYALQAVGTAAAVLDQSDMAGGVNWDNFDADVTIPLGVTVYGKFTQVSLGSGAVLAYKAC